MSSSSESEYSEDDLTETSERNARIHTGLRRSNRNTDPLRTPRNTRGQRLSNRNTDTLRTPSNTTGRRQKKRPMSLRQRENKLLLEQRRLINSKIPMIPRLPFSRLVREYIQQYSTTVDRITETALVALQETCEEYITQVLSDAYLLALHCRRVTLMIRDLQVLAILRNIH